MEKDEEKLLSRRRLEKWVKIFLVFLAFVWLCTIISKSIYVSGLSIVKTDTASKKYVEHLVEADGIVTAGGEVAVNTQAGLRVDKIFVREGDAVKAGDLLFTIDTADIADIISTRETELSRIQCNLSDLQVNAVIDAQKKEIAILWAQEDYETADKETAVTKQRAFDALGRAEAALERHLADPAPYTGDNDRRNAWDEYHDWVNSGYHISDQITAKERAIQDLQEQLAELESQGSTIGGNVTSGDAKSAADDGAGDGGAGDVNAGRVESGSGAGDADAGKGESQSGANDADAGADKAESGFGAGDASADAGKGESESGAGEAGADKPESGAEAGDADAGKGESESGADADADSDTGTGSEAGGSTGTQDSDENTENGGVDNSTSKDDSAETDNGGSNADNSTENNNANGSDDTKTNYTLSPADEEKRIELLDKIKRANEELLSLRDALTRHDRDVVEQPDFLAEEAAFDAWQNTRLTLEENVQRAKESYNDASYAREVTLRQKMREIASAATTSRADSTAALYELDIQQLQKQIERLYSLKKKKGEVRAENDGIISRIQIEVGGRTTDTAALLLTDAQRPCQFKCSITKEQGKYVHLNDTIEMKLSGQTSAMEVRVDYFSENAQGGYDIFCMLPEGVGQPGLSGTVKKSIQGTYHDLTLPVEAVFEEEGAFYIYTLNEKAGILGSEYYAEKLKVQIADKNDRYAAVEPGTINADTQIITYITQELKQGQSVRPQEK